MKNFKTLFIISMVFNIGLAVACIFLLNSPPRPSAQTDSNNYPFLSKRIFAEKPNDIIINFIPLRNDLQAYADKQPEDIGIYFEYIPSGTSIGINGTEPFFAASLIKVPVAMKTYKLIEEGKLQKDQKVVIQESDIDKGFGTLWQKGVGAEIPLKEVIKLAVSESDNTADKILRRLVQAKPVSDVFNYLDIPTNVNEGPGAGVSAKSFSSIFRSLYFSSYLSYENSNELLDLLTQSPYKNRLAQAIPGDIKVAHKIGIYEHKDSDKDQVHSDCGIVFMPKRPYMLCVFSNDDEAEATKIIQDVSQIVYKHVSSNH